MPDHARPARSFNDIPDEARNFGAHIVALRTLQRWSFELHFREPKFMVVGVDDLSRWYGFHDSSPDK